MNLSLFLSRVEKIVQVAKSRRFSKALFCYRVLVGAEHRNILSSNLKYIVDIGANRGQFSLAARKWAPLAKVVSFEPLPAPSEIYRKVFRDDKNVELHLAAIGSDSGEATIHISHRDDSSSLLPIGEKQVSLFPGTHEKSTTIIRVAHLDEFLVPEDIISPSMLKIDVQGFEFETLLGSESLLQYFDCIYVECSFIELYEGQKLANEIIKWLSERGFVLVGIYNMTYDSKGRSVQADFLFNSVD